MPLVSIQNFKYTATSQPVSAVPDLDISTPVIVAPYIARSSLFDGFYTANTIRKFDFSGNVLFDKGVKADRVVEGSDGTLYAFYNDPHVVTSVLAAYNTDGVLLWQKTLSSKIASIDADKSSTSLFIIMMGKCQILKVDASGNIVWQKNWKLSTYSTPQVFINSLGNGEVCATMIAAHTVYATAVSRFNGSDGSHIETRTASPDGTISSVESAGTYLYISDASGVKKLDTSTFLGSRVSIGGAYFPSTYYLNGSFASAWSWQSAVDENGFLYLSAVRVNGDGAGVQGNVVSSLLMKLNSDLSVNSCRHTTSFTIPSANYTVSALGYGDFIMVDNAIVGWDRSKIRELRWDGINMTSATAWASVGSSNFTTSLTPTTLASTVTLSESTYFPA